LLKSDKFAQPSEESRTLPVGVGIFPTVVKFHFTNSKLREKHFFW